MMWRLSPLSFRVLLYRTGRVVSPTTTHFLPTTPITSGRSLRMILRRGPALHDEARVGKTQRQEPIWTLIHGRSSSHSRSHSCRDVTRRSGREEDLFGPRDGMEFTID